ESGRGGGLVDLSAESTKKFTARFAHEPNHEWTRMKGEAIGSKSSVAGPTLAIAAALAGRANASRRQAATTLRSCLIWIKRFPTRVGSSIDRAAPKAFGVGSELKNFFAAPEWRLRVGSSIGRAAPF